MKFITTFLVFNYSLLIFSQGQVEMNDIAYDSFYQSNKIKDSLVVELLKMNKDDSIFTKNFEASEKLWNAFVDEQFKIKFPEYETWETRREIYGSQFDMNYYQFLKLYCDLRISTLLDMLEKN
ncbi:MAG: hypothetical protein CMO82_04150 [Winogradskyella sp.]|nr:hypothetical protein [Winogradskyella sp.]|tara:strand:+ start:1457 stop:1825 length:369 start_codon:yes stop_codon:yes gene_type:complete